MERRICACENCNCEIPPVASDDSAPYDHTQYCCKACADRHPAGLEHCHNPDCHCGKGVNETHLDEALDETFPASDPISP